MTAALVVGTTIHDELVTVTTAGGWSRVEADGARINSHRREADALAYALSIVPPHRRPCQGCAAEPGEACSPFCLSSVAGCSWTPDPDSGRVHDADGWVCSHGA